MPLFIPQLNSEPSIDGENDASETPVVKEEPSDESVNVKTEPPSSSPTNAVGTPIKKEIKTELIPKELRDKVDELQRQRAKDSEIIKDLRAQLKKAQTDVKEMKVLLDMFKTLPKEHRDKAGLMAAEKKVKMELEESRIGESMIMFTFQKGLFLMICYEFDCRIEKSSRGEKRGKETSCGRRRSETHQASGGAMFSFTKAGRQSQTRRGSPS